LRGTKQSKAVQEKALSGLLYYFSTQGRCGGCVFSLQRVESAGVEDKIRILFVVMNVCINQVSHTAYFITARMSIIPPVPSGCCLIHSPIFDNFPGLASMACLSALLSARFSAALSSFVIMTELFYNLQMQRYNFSGFSQDLSPQGRGAQRREGS
jgi:hypothetical protein